MLMPTTIVGKKYTKMLMRFYFHNNMIVHKKKWMYRFIKFMRDKKRLCFLGIKRNKPSVCLGHNFFKIQIEKYSSGIWILNNYKQAGVISKKTNIGPNIWYNVVIKLEEKE